MQKSVVGGVKKAQNNVIEWKMSRFTFSDVIDLNFDVETSHHFSGLSRSCHSLQGRP